MKYSFVLCLLKTSLTQLLTVMTLISYVTFKLGQGTSVTKYKIIK